MFPYNDFIHQYFLSSVVLLQYINTVTDFENYEKPISQAIGITEEYVLNLQSEFIAKINFEQLVVETQDGYLKRSTREDRKMQFKNTVFRAKKRASGTSRFLRVEIELTDDVMLVQRVYPNLIDLFSDIGSVV